MRIFFSITAFVVLATFIGGGVARSATSGQSLYPRLDRPDVNHVSNQRPQTGPSPDDLSPAPDDSAMALFQEGYRHYTSERYQEAAKILFQFLSEKTPDDEEYEWAEFFFGLSLKRLGFSHASVDTLTSVMTRKPNAKIVGYSLEVMEEISRTIPFDRDLLINRGICDQSYDFVDDAVTDFVHYYQGEYDWERGLFEWGDKHFALIHTDTYYYNMYLFKKALRRLYENRVDDAVTLLKKILQKTPDGTILKDEARKTLARLYYEKGEYGTADFLYLQIEMNIVEQAANLLERAWSHYRMGNPERAMGLLYSFEAPSYANSFTPEFYILKSFIFKDVCHYKKALEVLDQFKERYGDSLQSIYQRRPFQENKAMLLVLLNKPKVNKAWRFLNLLDAESGRCEKIGDPALQAYLAKLYSLKKEDAENRFRLLIRDEFENMANDMLRFEEEANLMEYEIGLDMYQRVTTYHYAEGKPSAKKAEDGDPKVVYNFQGEFWNDELDDYKVTLPNKCENAEEWDIFFK